MYSQKVYKTVTGSKVLNSQLRCITEGTLNLRSRSEWTENTEASLGLYPLQLKESSSFRKLGEFTISIRQQGDSMLRIWDTVKGESISSVGRVNAKLSSVMELRTLRGIWQGRPSMVSKKLPVCKLQMFFW